MDYFKKIINTEDSDDDYPNNLVIIEDHESKKINGNKSINIEEPESHVQLSNSKIQDKSDCNGFVNVSPIKTEAQDSDNNKFINTKIIKPDDYYNHCPQNIKLEETFKVNNYNLFQYKYNSIKIIKTENEPNELKKGNANKNVIKLTTKLNFFLTQDSTSIIKRISNKTVKYNGNLLLHIQIHSGERIFKTCGICVRTFACTSELMCDHRLQHIDKLFKCYVCGKILFSSPSLLTHLKIHKVKYPIHFDPSIMVFRSGHEFNDHTQTRTGEKLFQCEICEKEFNCSLKLLNHMWYHTVF